MVLAATGTEARSPEVNKSVIIDVLKFQRSYLSLLVDDIPEARMTEQPGGGAVPNHPAWQIGHLACVADNFTGMFGGEKTLGSWAGLYGQGSKPVADPSTYGTKAELLRTLDERRGALARALERFPDESFRQPNPNPMLAKPLPTLEHVVQLLLMHEGTHLGQLAAWRRAAGMCEALSALGR
jgi:hypothetical protein